MIILEKINGMEYNNGWGQFILDKDYPYEVLVVDNLDVFFGSRNNYLKRLLEVSDDIYHYVNNSTRSNLIERKWERIHDDTKALQALKRAMVYQLRYYITSGGGAIKDQTGMDIHKNRVVDISKLRNERSIAPAAISELKKVPYIMYRGGF